ELDPQQNELTAGHTVPRDTAVESEPIQGEPCRFRTCYPVTLWPIEVRSADLARRPFVAPPVPAAGRARPVFPLAPPLPPPPPSPSAPGPWGRSVPSPTGKPSPPSPSTSCSPTTPAPWPWPGPRTTRPRLCSTGSACSRSALPATRGCCRTPPARFWATAC